MNEFELKKITINSPAGSGNVFCQFLIGGNMFANLSFAGHDVRAFDYHGINLYILRSPYDTIASGVEINFEALDWRGQEFFLENFDYMIKDSIISQQWDYDRFLHYAQSFDHVTTVDFELLTKSPQDFLDLISKKFDIPFKEKRLATEDTINSLKKDRILRNRLPRDPSEIRKKINLAVNSHEPLKYSYQAYSEYIDKIDLRLIK
jgi:hypothetical protein